MRPQTNLPDPSLPVMKSLGQLVEALQERFGEGLISVVLYGSWARGQMGPESDVDLLIIAEGLSESSLDRQALFTQLLYEVIESAHERGSFPYISAILKTPEEADRVSRIYFDMVEEAKILFDKDDFFKGLLKRVQKRLEELGARRIQVGKMWYWDLRPNYRPGEIFEI